MNRDKNLSAAEDPTHIDKTTKITPNKRVKDEKILTENHSQAENRTLTDRVETRTASAMKVRGTILTENQIQTRRTIPKNPITKIAAVGTKGVAKNVRMSPP